MAEHSFQRAALVALLAIASFAVLPFLHVLSSNCAPSTASCSSDQPAPTHSPDCGVCGSLAHAGARAVDVPAAVAAIALPVALLSARHAPAPLAPSRERVASPARGPPAPPSHV
ncbi:MAG TPA: hypothetical protein VEN47_05340 [Myxococcota bacterium]|nr:hypothetical protein [Myxococcota bacterium]